MCDLIASKSTRALLYHCLSFFSQLCRFWQIFKLKVMEPKQLQSLVSGYRRELEEFCHDKTLNQILPDDIITIIFATLFTLSFEWNRDEKAHGTDITIIDDRTIMHSPKENESEWCIFTASNILSATDKYKKFKWEITIKEIEEDNTPYMNGRIGFVIYPISESIPKFNGNMNNLAEYHRDKQTSIKIFKNSTHLELYNNTNSFKTIKCESMCHTFGDRYCLLFDFEKKIVTVYYNDEYVDIMHDKLPDKVVPAMSFYTNIGKKAMAICTKWEVV